MEDYEVLVAFVTNVLFVTVLGLLLSVWRPHSPYRDTKNTNKRLFLSLLRALLYNTLTFYPCISQNGL